MSQNHEIHVYCLSNIFALRLKMFIRKFDYLSQYLDCLNSQFLLFVSFFFTLISKYIYIFYLNFGFFILLFCF